MGILSFVTLWFVGPFSTLNIGIDFGRLSFTTVCVCVSRITDALAAIEEEQQRTTAERDAFTQFARQIAKLEATEPAKAASPVESVVVADQADTQDLCTVREAYRETVMDVDHYEEEYDEPLAEHMSGEFSAELALTLVSGETLSPQLRQALVQASNRARDERASFVRTLDQEQNALEDAKDTLMEVASDADELAHTRFHQRSIDELIRMYIRSMDLEERCKQILTERQEQLEERGLPGGKKLQEYLHASHEWTYPVLLAGVNSITQIRKIER